MVQATYGPEAALPLALQHRNLAETVYGSDSVAVGQAAFALGQIYAVNSDLVSALDYMKSAQSILSKHLGDDAKEATEAANLVRFIEQAVARDAQDQRLREERYKKSPLVTANRSNAVRIGGGGPASSTAAVSSAKESAGTVQTPREHGQKAGLSVDELVDFIQGSSSKSKSTNRTQKRKASP